MKRTVTSMPRTYYYLLAPCAQVGQIDSAEKRVKIFQIAAKAFQDVTKSFTPEQIGPGYYGMILNSAGALMASNAAKHDEIVEKIFTKCCQEGLQLQLLGGFLEDGVRLPDAWSANVE